MLPINETFFVCVNYLFKNFPLQDETKNDESSFDGKYLQDLLTKLTACKDDAQQRSWSLFEDQQTITGYLEEILSILVRFLWPTVLWVKDSLMNSKTYK